MCGQQVLSVTVVQFTILIDVEKDAALWIFMNGVGDESKQAITLQELGKEGLCRKEL